MRGRPKWDKLDLPEEALSERDIPSVVCSYTCREETLERPVRALYGTARTGIALKAVEVDGLLAAPLASAGISKKVAQGLNSVDRPGCQDEMALARHHALESLFRVKDGCFRPPQMFPIARKLTKARRPKCPIGGLLHRMSFASGEPPQVNLSPEPSSMHDCRATVRAVSPI